MLRPGGTFTTFQYLHAYHLSPARTFRRAMKDRVGHDAERLVVFRNLPPAFVFTWTFGEPQNNT